MTYVGNIESEQCSQYFTITTTSTVYSKFRQMWHPVGGLKRSLVNTHYIILRRRSPRVSRHLLSFVRPPSLSANTILQYHGELE